MDVTLILVVVGIFLFTRWAWSYLSLPSNLPPGPWGLPLWGHLMESSKLEWPRKMAEYRKQYGDIYRLRFGPNVAVVLCGEAVKECLVEKADYFSDRPNYMILVNKLTGGKGIIYSSDWRRLRKMAMSVYRDIGVGAKTQEGLVHAEITAVTQHLEEMDGKPFDCKRIVTNAVSNVICSVVFGERFRYDDKEFVDAVESFDAAFEFNFLTSPGNFIWWYTYLELLMQGTYLLGLQKSVSVIRRFIMTRIQRHKDSFDPDNVRDFIDVYLKNEREEGGKKIEDEDAFQMIMDQFGAGTETTSTFLRWMFAFMINYPEVQDKCRCEIMEVMGPERLPSMADRPHMVYVDATIHEMLRLANIAFSTLPHVASHDVQVRGFTIPKGAFVIPNLECGHFDEKVWGADAKTFRPERWIDSNGKLKKMPLFMPFGAGRRACLGEQLARLEQFLFTTAFIQRFKFKAPGAKPSLEPHSGITQSPGRFQMLAERI